MDRVFKRVAEGIATFDNIYDKVQSSTNHSQKEKLESDLKREIKKLQRLRDQIKTWMGSNDIKDKKALTEQRRLIEQEMERFKACEKEMKTKAYSKEGLTSFSKSDPREKEKAEASNFINSVLEELEQQMETLESEQDGLQSTMKKGKKDTFKSDRISEIEDTLDRHKWHISKLEIMLRMIENGTLLPESVMNLQDDIKYYIDSNQDADFAEDEEIYDELNLEDDVDFEAEPIPVKEEGTSLEDLAMELSKEIEKQKQSNEVNGLSAGTGASPVTTATVTAGVGASPAAAATAPAKRVVPSSPSVANSGLHKSASSTNTASQLPNVNSAAAKSITADLKYSSTAGAGVIPRGLSPLPPPKNQPGPAGPDSASPSPVTSSSTIQKGPQPVVQPPTAQSNIPWSERLDSSRKTTAASTTTTTTTTTTDEQNKVSPSISGSTTSSPRLSTVSPLSPSSSVTTTTGATTANTSGNSNNSNIANTGTTVTFPTFSLPPGLQDLAHAFDAARRRIGSPAPISTISKLLEASFLNCPDSLIADRPRYYHPESPFPTPAYYPEEPLTNLDSAAIMAKMDLDTLFYIFYYRQGTYQQYLAAKELKNRSWRFHKLFLTWFQRHEEPMVISSEFEQGTYRFFDFEGSWMQRRKTNFKFEYQYLEDEI